MVFTSLGKLGVSAILRPWKAKCPRYIAALESKVPTGNAIAIRHHGKAGQMRFTWTPLHQNLIAPMQAHNAAAIFRRHL